MFLSFCGKTPRDEGAAFVAPSATVQGDVVLKPGSTVWYGAVLRGDDGTLTIGKNSNDVLTAVVGVKYQGTYCLNSNWSLKPNARLAVTYDLMSDKENSVVSLANGSGYVVDGQRLKRLGLEVGAGIAADLNENLEIGLSYEGKFRDNYTDNTGLIEARYKF